METIAVPYVFFPLCVSCSLYHTEVTLTVETGAGEGPQIAGRPF